MMTREKAQAARLAEEEEARRDWHDALQSEAAFRVFLGLLEAMGANRLMVTEDDMRLRNVAEQILDRIADADPESYVRMVRALKGI